uniref:Uncharacterized protein n=1 Tax=viral metagenome TaxID=1070528 RepID=A0A6C0B0V1_9ZZZZ
MNSVAIIINSCYKFHKITIDKIIFSAKQAKIPPSNIYIVVGESDIETDIVRKDDYNIIYCKYVNIDYNAAIYFSQSVNGKKELEKYTHFFYTHDTTFFLEYFWDRICECSKYCDMYIKLENVFSKSIGLFNVTWFIDNKTYLLGYYINYNKDLIMEYKHGNFTNKDLILSKFKNLPECLNEDCLFLFGENNEAHGMFFINDDKPVYKESFYSTEDRVASVYFDPGIIKYQKNWGQNNVLDLTL